MQRIFLNEFEFNNKKLIDNNYYHQAIVLRIKKDALLEAVYDAKLFDIKIINIDEKEIDFEIIAEKEYQEKKHSVTLIQGMPKGDKVDDILKHGTELGCDNFYLVNMKRSISILDNKKFENKKARLDKILENASSQSKRTTIPETSFYDNLNKIDYEKFDMKLLLDEEEAKKRNPRTLKDIPLGSNICFVIGPEGGIDDKERDYLLEKGFIPISIAKYILRTETASLAFLSVLDYKIGSE